MNNQQVVQPRSSSNGYGHHKINSSRTIFGEGGVPESTSRDRLIYLTTCLIGNQVEVQLLDGSVFSGIFHATNTDDFGIVLKMAHLTKDGSQGQRNISDSSTKPPSKTLIIPAKDLVQVIAKGVPVTRDGFTNELQHEKQHEFLTDSCISQSRHMDLGRELERWVPDEDDSGCPELENIFDGSWNRGWNQFEVNETLFGVKSTFNEELYTTKLERGPKTRELEREALRIAREIEGEDTVDLHLAEERGIQIDGDLEMDEETRFSSVYRGTDDSGFDEIEDILLNSRNVETFGSVDDSVIGKTLTDTSYGKSSDVSRVPSISSFMGEVQSYPASTGRDVYHSDSGNHDPQLLAEHLPKDSSVTDASRVHDNQFLGHSDSSYPEDKEKQKVGLSPNATAFDPSPASSKGQEKARYSNEPSEGRGGATSTSTGRAVSPSSSVGSLSSEKSTLNPHAKEFKFNPKAKSFTPSQTPLRPSSPVADSPFYYPPNMQGMPVGIGIGPSFAPQQPVMFNPHAAQMPQAYYHPNGPQYGQQMVMGQSRPVMYMPTYTPEMPYKGREF